MKILIVIDQFDNGNNGTTMSAIRFAKTLEKHGNEVFIVSTGEPAPNKYVVKDVKLPPIVSHIVKEQGMVFAMPNKKTLREAMQDIDVIHFYLPFGLSVQGLKIAKELHIPVTAAFHMQPENVTYTIGLGKSARVNDAIYRFYRDKFYNQFGHIHCPSEFIASELKRMGYTAKLHVISNGVDPEFVYEKKEKAGELKDKFVITMIGRYSNEKRQDVLIEAVGKSKYADKIQLVLAGKGLKEKEYAKLGEKLKNKPILKFYDKEELLDLLAMSDLYVHSADAEIEAISCIEAFSRGVVPVISNSPKSATKQFALGENNLFEHGNSSALAEKIDYWMEHEEERKKMEKEYSEYGKNFSIDKSIEKMEEMFREAIADNM